MDHRSKTSSASVVVSELRRRLLTGHYPEGSWLPPERELAAQLGASRSSVRKAIEVLARENLLVRLPRCRPIVRKPPQGVRKPVSEVKRHTLQLLLWRVTVFAGSASILRGIYQVLDHTSYRLIVESPRSAEWEQVIRDEAQLLEQVIEEPDIAGLIVWYMGGEQNLPALRKVRAAGIPIVFIDRLPPPGFPADFVGVDNRFAAEQVVRHLIEQGHKHIVHITNRDRASTVQHRKEGYRNALRKAGIPLRPEYELVDLSATDEQRQQSIRQLVEQILRLPGPPTAVFAVNDGTALLVVQAFREMGIRVPEDIAVCGFDGLERLMPGPRFLTTADQPFERIGEAAAQLLLERLSGNLDNVYQHIIFEAPLSVHESTQRTFPASADDVSNTPAFYPDQPISRSEEDTP